MNLAIVRLACCCGLRVSEIGGLCIGDVNVGISRPFLQVRAEHAKLGRPRRVPLWWDAGTLLRTAVAFATGYRREEIRSSCSITRSSLRFSSANCPATSWP
jgi:integrase